MTFSVYARISKDHRRDEYLLERVDLTDFGLEALVEPLGRRGLPRGRAQALPASTSRIRQQFFSTLTLSY